MGSKTRISQKLFLDIKNNYLLGYSLNFLCEKNGVSISTIEKKKKTDEKLNGKWIKGSGIQTYFELVNSNLSKEDKEEIINEIHEEAKVEIRHLNNIKNTLITNENNDKKIKLSKSLEEAFGLKIKNMLALREFKLISHGLLPSDTEAKLVEAKWIVKDSKKNSKEKDSNIIEI